MGRDTPLGEKRKNPCGKKALWSGPLVFWASGGVSVFPVLFLLANSGFSLYSPRIPPSVRTLVPLAYCGVPDAGRDGVWIPAQTNADRPSAVTG